MTYAIFYSVPISICALDLVVLELQIASFHNETRRSFVNFFICDIIQAFLLKCVKQCESYGLRNKNNLHSHMYPHALECATRKKWEKVVYRIKFENPITKRFSQLCNMKNAPKLSGIYFLHVASETVTMLLLNKTNHKNRRTKTKRTSRL